MLEMIEGKAKLIEKLLSEHYDKFEDTLEKYEDEFNEPIKLSVISTYLSRFSSKGRVDRTRNGREWTYQTIKIGQKQH